MPGQTYTSSQVHEIARLETRIAVNQFMRGPLQQSLNRLRAEHGMHNASISHIRNKIRRTEQDAQAALSTAQHQHKVQTLTELNRQLASSVQRLEEVEGHIQRQIAALGAKDQETMALERALLAIRAVGVY
ncbi:hypothetical protein MMC31_001249 [Peltigera leucophlebia]|nr:hypothetical protein [Peltigera leucophlebia]